MVLQQVGTDVRVTRIIGSKSIRVQVNSREEIVEDRVSQNLVVD